MKYLKLFESYEEIDKMCKIYLKNLVKSSGLPDYTINPDDSVDANGNVDLSYKNFKKLPIKFNKVDGWFYCQNNKLTSLEGSPKEVNRVFYCYNNNLTSFRYAPKIMRSDFACNRNKINSFEYFPSHIGGYFHCGDNPIYNVWYLFQDTTKIELLNDFDIFRDEDTNKPAIIMDRLNDFLLTIGKEEVGYVKQYKNI